MVERRPTFRHSCATYARLDETASQGETSGQTHQRSRNGLGARMPAESTWLQSTGTLASSSRARHTPDLNRIGTRTTANEDELSS
jgi:hypothetical protein